MSPSVTPLTPEAELRSFIAGFNANTQKLFRSLRAAIRKRFPAVNELVYNYNTSIVISYTPTERGIDGVVAIAVRPDDVRLYFHGKKLPDPKKLLQGSGKQARFIPVTSVKELSRPDVKALFAAVIDQAAAPMPSKGKGRVIVQSSGEKRRKR